MRLDKILALTERPTIQMEAEHMLRAAAGHLFKTYCLRGRTWAEVSIPEAWHSDCWAGNTDEMEAYELLRSAWSDYIHDQKWLDHLREIFG